MIKFNPVFLALILTCSGAVNAEIYNCHINGKASFTDQPCDGEKVELKEINTLPAVKTGGLEKLSHNVYTSSIWHKDYSGYTDALRISQMYNAPIFLYFQADWCRYCDLLERELLDTKQGKQALSKAVKVLITPENGAQEKRLFKQMRGKGYPTTLIKQPNGSAPIKYTLIRKVNNSWTTKSAGYLEQIINPIY